MNGKGGISEDMEKDLVKRLLERAELEDEHDYALAASNVGMVQIDGAPNHPKAEFCQICQLPSREDPVPDKRIMYLHAWKYQAKDWAFETDLPDWAKEAAVSEASHECDSAQ